MIPAMTGSGRHNGNGQDREPANDDGGNILAFRRPDKKPHPPGGPMINLPPATKLMVLAIVGVHILTRFVSPPAQYWLFANFGFVPAAWTGRAAFTPMTAFSPLTYMLLHGGWSHVLMNGVMLMAFGTGIERWLGGRRMCLFLVLCGLASALVHFALNPFSADPVVGASGGISGLFAAVLVMMQRMGQGVGGRHGLWPFILLWVVISVLFGITGGPGGSSIAWAAHIGGFLAGLLFLKPVMRLKK